jgi:fructose-bisphosphate aldolase class I
MNTPFASELIATANAIVSPGRGILAADESTGTIGKRFEAIGERARVRARRPHKISPPDSRLLTARPPSTLSIPSLSSAAGVENTEENRRAYRELLVSTPGLGQFVSGFLVFEETLTHKAADGTPLVDIAKKAGMIIGIKVDKGTVPIPGTDGETDTQGHTDLCVVGAHARMLHTRAPGKQPPLTRPPTHPPARPPPLLRPPVHSGARCAKYYQQGARFAKWRAVIKISSSGCPSDLAIKSNCDGLSRYAAICQMNGLVPIVEPEILMDGALARARVTMSAKKALSSSHPPPRIAVPLSLSLSLARAQVTFPLRCPRP